MNRILLTGAALGLLSVVVGALADHGPFSDLDAAARASVMTAIRYHQVGSVLVASIGLALCARLDVPVRRRLVIAAGLFIAGTLLFSFSIYASALSGIQSLTWITPFGGVTLMAAWAALGWAALSARPGS